MVSSSGLKFKLTHVSDNDFSGCPMLKFGFNPDSPDMPIDEAANVDMEIDTTEGVN